MAEEVPPVPAAAAADAPAADAPTAAADAPAPVRPPVKLFIATPAYGCYVCKEYLSALLMLRVLCAKNGIETSVKLLGNESLITRARNIIVAEFLKSGSTHLLFIDADINFMAESVLAMLGADKDVMCGIYSKKSYNWDKLALRAAHSREPLSQLLLDFNINIVADTPVIQNRFVRIHDGATGFMLIKRSVLERMYEAFPELTCVNDIPSSRDEIPSYVAVFETMIDPRDRRYLSEDYAFVRRYQSIGGEVWCDLDACLGHIGNYTFSPANSKVVGKFDELVAKKTGGGPKAGARA